MRHIINNVSGNGGETDFMRKHNNEIISKQNKIKSIKIKTFHVVFILCVIAFIAISIYQMGKFLLTWEKLNIKSYKLVNKPELRTRDVYEVISRYGGNILALNLNQLNKELLSIPEIREVSVSRVLPDTIEIHFTLRKPAFQVETNDKYNIIDDEGVILSKSNEQIDQLITIRNTHRSRQSLLIPYLSQLEAIKKDIEYVALLVPYGIQLKIKGIDETFYPGVSDFAAKINYYLKMKDKLAFNKNKIKNVDLRFEDRFYLEYEEEVSQSNEK